jgi:site-specific recombinase XerD
MRIVAMVPHISRDNACREIRKVFERAGLDQKGRPCLHWVRRSVCSTLLGEGVDVESVRQQMGHASIMTTQLYAYTSEEGMKRASRALDLGWSSTG